MQFITENIWFILIAVILIVGGGSFFLIRGGFIHRVFDWMKPTSDKFIPAKYSAKINRSGTGR